MYFDKASSLIPFVSNPFFSVCYLYSRINCYCYKVLYFSGFTSEFRGKSGKVEDLITIAVDSTVKVTNREEWIRDKWNKRRGFIKIHIQEELNSEVNPEK